VGQRGRNLTLSKDQVNGIIGMFKAERKTSGLIKPMEMFKFTEELYNQGRIPSLPSYEFWKKKDRLGRQLIEQRNRIDTVKLTNSEGKEITIPNVTDLVEKKHKSKEELLEALVPLENHLRNSINREINLKEKVASLEVEISNIKLSKKELLSEKEELQNLVFELYRMIMKEYKSETKEFALSALQNVFKNPLEILMHTQEKSDNDSNQMFNEENIVSIESKKSFKNKFRAE
jgi:hypothetical protein